MEPCSLVHLPDHKLLWTKIAKLWTKLCGHCTKPFIRFHCSCLYRTASTWKYVLQTNNTRNFTFSLEILINFKDGRKWTEQRVDDWEGWWLKRSYDYARARVRVCVCVCVCLCVCVCVCVYIDIWDTWNANICNCCLWHSPICSGTVVSFTLILSIKLNCVVWVRTERQPLFGEVSTNFWGQSVPRGQRDGSLQPYSRFSRSESRQ
jgi:hypothetical protein